MTFNDGRVGSLAGGGGTITIGPAQTTKIYPNQGRYITATVKMKVGNPIPEGATIDFSKNSTTDSAGFKTLFGEPAETSVRIAIDPQDSTQGVAKLCIRYDPTAGTNAIVVNAQAGAAGWTGPKPDDAATATYTVLAGDPTIICSGASKTVLAIPSATDGDTLTPSNDECTTQFTCTVTDGGTPVPDYVVEWHESATSSRGLFSLLMNAYTAATATIADKLPSSDAVFLLDRNKGDFVRTVTDINGTANLYLVAKHTYGAIAQGITACYDFGVNYEYPRPLLVIDTRAADLKELYPQIVDVMVKDTLDYGTLENPPYVSVTIPDDPAARPKDDIYLIVNKTVAAGPYHRDSGGAALSARVLASLCFSDYFSGGGEQKNQLLFVVGSVDKGHAYASSITGFFGTGDNTQLVSGGLDAPLLDPSEASINSTTLDVGWVGIDVQLDQSASNGWVAKVGDTIGATAVLTGYKPNSDVLRQPVTVTATPPPPITNDDLDRGFVLVKFPTTQFKGWDSRKTAPERQGRCCILYTVQGTGGEQSSQLLSVILNTADLS